ncbi:MAG: hypothetical protein QY318_04440 [Candidatus Dojkabacteria bacterium]|nr:MAG: hypothetical protein QY318_04440 [Candidatus Dojkabacteria bacterium]
MKRDIVSKKKLSSLGRGTSSIIRRTTERTGKKRIIFIISMCLLFVFAFDPIATPQIESRLIEYNSENVSAEQSKILTEVENSDIKIFDSALALNLNKAPTDISNPRNVGSNFITTDPRNIAMRQFLEDHSSPMYPYAEVFVEEADEHGLDWRLVASISGVESAFGNITPAGSNNAWGWRGGRINGRSTWSRFATWSDGISVVTERLAKGYGTDLTPFQIEATYCPPCAQNPRHEWANGVNNYMVELNYYLEDL